MKAIEIFSLGENAVTVNFGNEISSEVNNRVIQLERYFNREPFFGFIEAAPAYSSLTLFFDCIQVRKNFSGAATAFDAVKRLVELALENSATITERSSRTIEIPVCFADEYALDLEFVSENKHLSKTEVVEIFTSQIYRVYMLGFLPGFAYMGEVSELIAAPRKQNPRTFVPKGSVGIAGRQTGIYPLASPGGWQIIGKTDLELFSTNEKNPTLLQTGDLVKFYPVDKFDSSVSSHQ